GLRARHGQEPVLAGAGPPCALAHPVPAEPRPGRGRRTVTRGRRRIRLARGVVPPQRRHPVVTEHPRPVPAHPTTDELADWHADTRDESGQAARISSHVANCPACAAEVAALDAVAAVLAEAGGEPVPMPDDVAASLDAALARVSLERAYDVPSLDERRAAS